ncbi:hypothetical protein L4X63_09990 [Geomonas sp. Red32]|uniref:hypothetical protein n=1 Tax=Geomonas sp. Red32 TaxID=2912856 RepID=UPI00202CC812|nr:hypothetical protein [Geomonas sp. Red32]MCM0081920.1 hypothetical protein [Geomonas sp. Red32]
MRSDKGNQEISVLGRLISLEALVFLMGIASLVYGLATANAFNLIIGAAITMAAVILAFKCRRIRPK